MQGFSDQWPRCLCCCGIMPETLPGLHETLAYATAQFAEDAPPDKQTASVDDSVHWSGREPRFKDGRAVVYTDGACSRNQDARFR
eukprot:11005868-Karenia_brevis.AAC.1